jgi:hypothetical protein
LRASIKTVGSLGHSLGSFMVRRSALLAPVVGILAVAGCTDPTAFASPSSIATASPTPRQTQAIPSLSRLASPTTQPAQTATPSAPVAMPTPPPHSDLEALLPDFSADGQHLDKLTATAEDLAGDNDTTRFIKALLADVGRPIAAIDVAVARGSWFGFTAIRVDGVSGDELSDATVKAMRGLHPGTESQADIDGHAIRWLRFQDDGPFPVDDARIFTNGDVVIIFNSGKQEEEVALASLRWSFKPRLEEVLPAALDGQPLERFTAPAAAFNLGGDICSFLCPAEVANLAGAVGVQVADMDVAGAFRAQPPALVVIAFAVPGQKAAALVDGRIQSGGHAGGAQVVPRDVSVGGKRVTWVNYSAFDSETEREYLHAVDGILFSIRPAPLDGTSVPPLVEKAIAALP